MIYENKTNQDITILKLRNEEIPVPKAKIQEFANALMTHPAYSANNVDTHISLMYTGNIIAVQEFLNWYEDNK